MKNKCRQFEGGRNGNLEGGILQKLGFPPSVWVDVEGELVGSFVVVGGKTHRMKRAPAETDKLWAGQSGRQVEMDGVLVGGVEVEGNGWKGGGRERASGARN